MFQYGHSVFLPMVFYKYDVFCDKGLFWNNNFFTVEASVQTNPD